MQLVPTGFRPVKLIVPWGTLPSFCRDSNFSVNAFLCPSHATPTMYSPSLDRIEITNSGGIGQSCPFFLMEQRSGNTDSFFDFRILILIEVTFTRLR